LKRVGYVLASLTFFTNAFAQGIMLPEPTTTCPGFESFMGVGIVNNETGAALSCDQLKPLAEVYKEVSKLSSEDLPQPILIVFNEPIAGLEKYNLMSRAFQVGVNPTSEKEMKSMLRLFAHEMGHHIFYTNAYLNVPEYSEIKQLDADYLEALTLERTDSDAIFSSYMLGYFFDQLSTASQVVTGRVVYFDQIGDSYQELFADVVAAVHLEDPEVMESALADFGISDPDSRSFLLDHLMTDEKVGNPYYQFVSVRATLWREWIQPRLGAKPTIEKKKALINELLQISISEIRRRRDLGETGQEVRTMEEAAAHSELVVADFLKALGIEKK
jgi:hypothetical protein